MIHPFPALALQAVESDNSSMWIIIAVVLVVLVFIVVIIGVGLTIFFIARKRSKAQKSATAAGSLGSGPGTPAYADTPPGSIQQVAPDVEPQPLIADAAVPATGSPMEEEIAEPDFDPSRTVAINREPTVQLSFGSIKFVSGVLVDQEFDVKPEGEFIGRESSLSQIVVSDPRISKFLLMKRKRMRSRSGM